MTTSHPHKREDEHKKEDKIFACTKCNDKFDHLSELKLHQETHIDPLDGLKKEIILGVENEIKEYDNRKRLSWGSSLVTTILVILAIVSIVQTVQSANILSKINSGDFKSSGSNSTSTTSSPASLDELPQMVGGC